MFLVQVRTAIYPLNKGLIISSIVLLILVLATGEHVKIYGISMPIHHYQVIILSSLKQHKLNFQLKSVIYAKFNKDVIWSILYDRDLNAWSFTWMKLDIYFSPYWDNKYHYYKLSFNGHLINRVTTCYKTCIEVFCVTSISYDPLL